MYIYMLMLICSMLFAQLASNAKPYDNIKGSYYTFAVLSFLPFALNAMLRWEVGTDWPLYDSYYYYINNGIKEFSEPLFNWLNKFLYRITPDSVLMFAIVSFCTLLFFFMGIYHESPMIPFSIFLFFLTEKYFTSLNQIRQMLAMSIFVFSLRYIFHRKWFQYMLCIFTAYMIHTSSLIYIPVYFLYGIEYRFKSMIKGIVIYCISYPLVSILAVPIVKFTKFAWYMDSAYANEDFYLLGFVVTFFAFVLQIIGLYRKEKENCPIAEEKDDFKKQGFMTVMSLIACLTITLSPVIPQVSRISEGFSVVQIIGFPLLIRKEKERKYRMVFMIYIIGLYGFKFIYDVYKNNWNSVLPYQSLFFR